MILYCSLARERMADLIPPFTSLNPLFLPHSTFPLFFKLFSFTNCMKQSEATTNRLYNNIAWNFKRARLPLAVSPTGYLTALQTEQRLTVLTHASTSPNKPALSATQSPSSFFCCYSLPWLLLIPPHVFPPLLFSLSSISIPKVLS